MLAAADAVKAISKQRCAELKRDKLTKAARRRASSPNARERERERDQICRSPAHADRPGEEMPSRRGGPPGALRIDADTVLQNLC